MNNQNKNFRNIFSFYKSKKFLVISIIIFIVFFLFGYIGGTIFSYTHGWFGAGPTFWDALRPF